MGTGFRWPRTVRGQCLDLVNTVMNLQIRETSRNLWHNRVQSAQGCYLLLQFNFFFTTCRYGLRGLPS
jgi:hypothetical protein